MIQLVKSPVEFSENPHGYFLQGVQLSGITTLIKAATGLGVYAEASDYVKDFLIPKAGEKGTAVHNSIEKYDKTGEKRVKAYLQEMHVVIQADKWAEKYKNYGTEDGEDEDMPF